jgi:serine phosphatase RsbU (regulator of sigma subunit)
VYRVDGANILVESRDTPVEQREPRTLWLVGIDVVTRKVRLPVGGPILVGRGAYNHVVLKDSRISRQHARLAPERDGCVVYDLNSTNGTYVNNQPVTKRVLQPNEVVRFGPLAFRLEAGTDEDAEAMPADLEKPTLREFGSMSRMLVSGGRESSTQQLPVVDLGQLEDAYEKLGTLYSFMQAISKTIDRRELLELIAGQLGAVYSAASVVAIHLVVRENGSTTLRLEHYSSARSVEEPSVPPEVTAAIFETGEAVFSGSAMFAPLVDRGDTLGVIQVSRERGAAFSRADLDLLAGMAAPAAMMLQKTRMHEESLQRIRLNYDLELAARIQKSFLPREVVQVEGVELFAEYRAAYSVGGDFYDVFWLGKDRLGVFIGDIAGKGVSGALLMARISSELHVAALAHVDPVTVLATMNKALIGRNQPELFFTAIYLTLDVKSGEIVLANAGHPLPYVARSDGSVAIVEQGSAEPVGILDEAHFAATRLTLGNGDSLVLYTDGVIEAADPSGSLYGIDRLERCVRLAGRHPTEIAEHIMESVRHHTSDTPLGDDITLFICHRNVGGRPSLQPRRRSGTLPTPTTPF